MPEKVVIQLSAEGSEAVARIFRDLADKGNDFAKNVVSGGKRAEDSFNALGRSAKNIFEIFAGFSLANVSLEIARMAKDGIAELTKMGLENQRVEESFKRMASSVGISADTLVASLKRASGSIVDTNAVMLSSSKALAQGLNADQLTKIMETARAQSTLAGKSVAESFNAIAEGVTNLNARSLREFGIVIDLSRAYEQYASALGTTAAALTETGQRAAFMNAIDQQTLKNRASLTQGELTNAQEIEKAKAKWSDFFAVQAKGFADVYGAMVKGGAAFITWAQTQGTWLDQLAEKWERYKAVALWGPGTAFPNAAAQAGVGGTSFTDTQPWPAMSESAVTAADQVDKVKDALVKVDDAMAKLALSNAAGIIGATGYAAAIGQQVAKLQALGSTAPEVGAKILALQTQMATLTNNVAADITKMNETIEKLAGLLNRVDIQLSKSDLSGALNVTAVLNELTELSETLGSTRDEVEETANAARALAEAFEQLGPAQEALQKTFTGGPELTAPLIAVTRELMAIAAASEVDAEAIRQFGVSFEGLTEAEQRLIRLNQELKDAGGAKAFADSLQRIGVEAQLFGARFDAVAATISALESRLTDLARTSQGVVTPAMRELAVQLEELRKFQEIRDMFQDIFSSVGGAINTLVQGVILGTQTMAEAFKKLGQSIVVEFVNRVIQQALNPLVKAAAGAVATLFAPAGRATAGSAAPGAGANSGAPEWAMPGGGNGNGSSLLTGIPTGTFDLGTLSNIWTGLGNAWGAFNAALESGTSVVEAFSGAWESFSVPFQGAAGGLSTAIAGVGAALAVFGTTMDFINGKTAEGIGGVAGGVAGAVAGGLVGTYVFPGIGTVAGALAGGALGDWLGSMLGGLFGGGPSQYDLSRIAAESQANQALSQVGGGYAAAASTGNIAQVLAALQGGAGGAAGNSVRSELVLPTGLANQIGLTGQQIGDQLVTQWKDVTLEQFKQVVTAFKQDPGLIQNIRGSGDVPLLEGGDAAATADKIKAAAQGLLTAFDAIDTVRDKITTMGSDLVKAAGKVLPPNLANDFAGAIVNPIRDRMIAVLTSGIGVEEMQKQLDALSKELQSFAGMVALYGQLSQDIAQLSGDIETQTKGVILGITTMLEGANKAVSDAQAGAATAVGPEAQLAAESALRDAILGRYKLEMQLVQQIQDAIGQLLTVSASVQQTLTSIAVSSLSHGNAQPFQDILHALADMAMMAPTVAQKLYAIGQGISAIIASAPARVSAGSDITGTVNDLNAQAAPFFHALSELISTAGDAGDLQGQLSLLQQQADLIKQVGAAQIQAVEQWRDITIRAATEAADRQTQQIRDIADAQAQAVQDAADAHGAFLQGAINEYTAFVKGIQDGIAGQIEAIQGEADAFQEAVKGMQEGIASRIDGLNEEQDAIQASSAALQDQIQATKDWEKVMKSTADFIEDLKRGALSQANPAAKLTLARDQFDAAQRAFKANPTTEGAGDLQRLAQNLLTAGAAVFTEPSPKYQELFARVIAAMEAVKGTAAAQIGPATAADLAKQADMLAQRSRAIAQEIKALNAESQRIGKVAAAHLDDLNGQIKALQKENTRVGKIAADRLKDLQDQVEATNKIAKDQIDAIHQSADDQIKAVEDNLQAQLRGINQAADGLSEGIAQRVADALRINAAAQNAILGRLQDNLIDQLAVLTDGRTLQYYMAARAKETADSLALIQADIRTLVSGGIPQHAEGSMYTRGGLTILHPGEIVIPRRPSDLIRHGGLTDRGPSGGTLTVNVNVAGVDAKDTAALAAVIKREVVPVIEREMRGGKLGTVTVERVRGR